MSKRLNKPSLNDLFIRACQTGKIDCATWMFHQIDPSEKLKEEAFWWSCYHGHLEVAQWLYEISPTLDICAKRYDVFRSACNNGHLPIAQWLYEIYEVKPTLEIFSETFAWACYEGHLPVAQWLYEIHPILDVQDGYEVACCEGPVAQWIETLVKK